MRLKKYITELSMKADTEINISRDSNTQKIYDILVPNPDGVVFKKMLFKLYIWSEVYRYFEELGAVKNWREYTAWNIDFVDDQGNVGMITKTPAIALKLFAAIESIVSKFIKKEKPEIIKIIASDNEKSRLRLYELLARKIEKSGKYILQRPQKGYERLVRKDILK